MEKQTWLPEVLKGIGMIIIGIALIKLAIQRSKKRIDAQFQKQKLQRHPYAKDLNELENGEIIIIIDFNDAGKPIAQLAHEYAFDLPEYQKNFFVLQDAERFKLKAGKTYEIERIGPAQIVNLKQVAMMF